MGTSFSGFNASDENTTHNIPLPNTQILDPGPLAMRPAIIPESTRPSPPVNIPLQRLVLSFGISRDISVSKVREDCFEIKFMYKASCPINGLVSLGLKDGNSMSRVGVSLMETSTHAYAHAVVILSLDTAASTADPAMILDLTLTNGVDEQNLRAEVLGLSVTIFQHVLHLNLKEKAYNLMNLYTTANASCISSPDVEIDEAACAVCLTNRANTGFLPCRHVCVCNQCASETMKSSSFRCPICRMSVSGQIQLS